VLFIVFGANPYFILACRIKHVSNIEFSLKSCMNHIAS